MLAPASPLRSFVMPRLSLARSLPVLLALSSVVFVGCGREVEVRWTIEGRSAQDACADGAGDEVRLSSRTQDADGRLLGEGNSKASCGAGRASVAAGEDAQVLVELWRGGRAIGSAGPVLFRSGMSSADVDVKVHRGVAKARLTVLGEDCGDAGASSFNVSLRRDVGSGSYRNIDTEPVSCEGGQAILEVDHLLIDGNYFLYASADVGDRRYETPAPGVRLRPRLYPVEEPVELRDSQRLPMSDAGPAGYIDGGASADDDAGATDDDAGTSDAGADDAGAGAADAGATEDAGPEGCEVDSECADLDDGDLCNGTWRCEIPAGETHGECVEDATPVTCEDPGACKTATCEPTTGLCEAANVPNGTACDFGLGCTTGDSCQEGVCRAGTVGTCDCSVDDDCAGLDGDEDPCNGSWTCGVTEQCVFDAIPSCSECPDTVPCD